MVRQLDRASRGRPNTTKRWGATGQKSKFQVRAPCAGAGGLSAAWLGSTHPCILLFATASGARPKAIPMATATALYLSDPYLEQTQLFFLIPWPVDVSSKLAERGLDFLKYQQLEDGNTRYNNMTHCRTTNQATPLAQHHLKPRIYQLHDQF